MKVDGGKARVMGILSSVEWGSRLVGRMNELLELFLLTADLDTLYIRSTALPSHELVAFLLPISVLLPPQSCCRLSMFYLPRWRGSIMNMGHIGTNCECLERDDFITCYLKRLYRHETR